MKIFHHQISYQNQLNYEEMCVQVPEDVAEVVLDLVVL